MGHTLVGVANGTKILGLLNVSSDLKIPILAFVKSLTGLVSVSDFQTRDLVLENLGFYHLSSLLVPLND